MKIYGENPTLKRWAMMSLDFVVFFHVVVTT